MKIITNFSRVFVGVLFIFSGLIKANDPMGFGFKLEEYFEVFGTLFMIPTAMYFAIFICVLEVLLGIMLLVGKIPKLVNRLLLAMILFFTFLTFYSAYFDKVTDCGCFGDAISLTPWESFSKDLVLLFFVIILLLGEKHIKPIFNERLTNYITIGGTTVSLLFPIYTYNYLPVVDFRPYKIGTDIVEKMVTIRNPDIKIMYIYEKGGKQYEFAMEELAGIPDLASYNYVDRKDEIIDPGEPAPIHDFIFNDDNGNEVTNVFLDKMGYKLLSVQYDLEKTDKSKMKPLEELTSSLEKQGVLCYHVSAGSIEQIASLGVNLQFYSVDKTTLKTIIRSNPGLLLFKDNVIVMKWPSSRFPSVEEVMKFVE